MNVYVPTKHVICTILWFFLTNLMIFLFHDCARKSWDLNNLKIGFHVFSNVFTKNKKKIIFIILLLLLLYYWYIVIIVKFLIHFYYYFNLLFTLFIYIIHFHSSFHIFFYCKSNGNYNDFHFFCSCSYHYYNFLVCNSIVVVIAISKRKF